MAGKQSSASGSPSDIGVPEQVRQAAEATLAQAKQAVDQYLHQMTSLQERIGSSAEAAQSGAHNLNQNVWAAAEANINAALDFAQQLVRANDPQEMAALQQRFFQQQFERINTQMQEFGGTAARTAADMGVGARPTK